MLTHGILGDTHLNVTLPAREGTALQHCTQSSSIGGEENSDPLAGLFTTALRLLEKIILEIGCHINAF